MLDVCKKRFIVKKQISKDTNKLMDRMELDRPILQREKFELIFLEKFDQMWDESEEQESRENYNNRLNAFLKD